MFAAYDPAMAAASAAVMACAPARREGNTKRLQFSDIMSHMQIKLDVEKNKTGLSSRARLNRKCRCLSAQVGPSAYHAAQPLARQFTIRSQRIGRVLLHLDGQS